MGLAAGFVFLFLLSGHAQRQTVHGWVMSSHEQELSDRWKLLSDIELRSANHIEYLERILIRPAIQYKLNTNNSVALGYTYFSEWEIEQEIKNFALEHRAWEQY